MKIAVVVLVCTLCYVQSRKLAATVDKNAVNTFLHMESGGSPPLPTNVKPATPAVVQPQNQPQLQVNNVPAPASQQTKPAQPAVQPKPVTQTIQPAVQPKPVIQTQPAVQPKPQPVKPAVQPNKPLVPTQPAPTQSNQIKPVPVNPPLSTHPITTPGPGSVKQLINFYDSQGKASPIRPYTYSQAVKQG